MEPVASQANEVWLGAELAVRVNHPGLLGASASRLVREARIAARLPAAARYPVIVDAGADGELAWLITQRAPGGQLGRAWPGMSPAQRERAIGQLADALDALHGARPDDVPDDIDPPHVLPLAALHRTLDGLGDDRGLLEDVRAFIDARWSAFADAPRVLVHGDPHLENVLWDGADVTAVLDLEWSRYAFRECDAEILLAIAADPASFAAADHEATVDPRAYRDLARWLPSAWFEHPRVVERLELLAASRTLGFLVDAPGAPRALAELRAILDGRAPARVAFEVRG